ncbi:acyl-CoA dehydrogenase family protein [Herbiconiux sp.]|uniref:acyl-CoA dehydrogenase family protein n=1 Tax=Herbiconiux sp. TaxID=1871186 RepID=UPI0025C04417|nr:acyl-CoA dehydrogenase family protein [Herbiconiux sp.]
MGDRTERDAIELLGGLELEHADDRPIALEVIRGARALRGQLRDEQAESERRGTYSVAVHERMREAGLYRITAPRAYGGLQLPLPVLTKTIIEVAQGDPGSGWCYALAAGHQITMASYWPEPVQAAAFGEHGEFLAPHNFAWGGSAERVAGGWLIDGTFPFGSGAPYSTHFLLTITARDGDRMRPLTVVLERAEYEVLDDWSGAFGMKASGSNGVRVPALIVPDARAVVDGFDDPHALRTPGSLLHDEPGYFGRTTAYHPAGLAAVAVGTGRAALDEFERIIAGSASKNAPGLRKIDDPVYREVYGTALAAVDAAEALALAAAGAYVRAGHRAAAHAEALSVADEVRLANVSRTAGRLVAEAVDELFLHAGTLTVSDGSRMQRYFRDISMLRTHGRQLPRSSAVQLAGAVLDQEPSS